jgi:hypothetical protein
MLFTYLLFFFVAFGAKVLLAVATIYLIVPADRECPHCDGDTLPVQMGPVGRLVSRLLLGTIGWRWCPRCEWEGMIRNGGARSAGPSPVRGREHPVRHRQG